jgi:hypothetical protein
MDAPASIFERVVARPRRLWVTLGIAVLLFAAPVLAAYADSTWNDLLARGQWRGLFLSPTIIIYILLIAPRMSGMESAVLRSLRRAVQVDDDEFNRLVQRARRRGFLEEAIVFGAGALLGVGLTSQNSDLSLSWLGLEVLLSVALMYGLLAWIIYGSVLSTRQTTALLRQPLNIDPLDTSPFEPMGRQSLLLALVFVGGNTLSLPFVALQPGALLHLEFWLFYIPLGMVPVVIFFLGMAPVHRLLAGARDREQQAVKQQFLHLCRDLMQRLEGRQETGSLGAEINALVAYEEQLQAAPTWPYNTGMLRTLIFSVFIPAATVLAKIAVDVLL